MSARIDLHATLNKKSFGHAVLTTFCFDAEFFEEYCLEQLESLQDNNDVNVLMDRRELDRLLAGPPSTWPSRANVRYLLHPVDATGRFHPKVFLFASKERGLLVIGSANLTKAGLTQNGEMAVAFHFEAGKREQYASLFQQAFRFLRMVEERSPSSDLGSRLTEMSFDAPWLAGSQGASAGVPQLLHSLEEPIWKQICARVQGPIDALYVLAPYFDPVPDLLDTVRTSLSPKRCCIYTENGRTTLTDPWMEHDWVRTGGAEVRFCSILDEQRLQRLHAKALALVKGGRVFLVVGSANFTRAGLLSTPTNGNVEAVLFFESLPLKECNPERLFDPCQNARKEALRTEPRKPDASLPKSRIRLWEAILEDAHLTCRALVPDDLLSGRVSAVLMSREYGTRRVALHQGTGESWDGGLDRDFAARCDEAVVVQVEVAIAGSEPLLSNRALLVNLRDIVTGRSTRRERRVREAQKSAERFAAMLEELLKLDDADALKLFLTHCDIRLVGAGRHPGPAPGRPPWEGAAAELRRLGERNLQFYATLHEAAVAFCERHLRRLSRHSRLPGISGVASFMHIVLAVANVLCAQVERMLEGFQHKVEPLDAATWHADRERLDIYLLTFQRLVAIVEKEYLPTLLAAHEDQVIREALAPDLEPYRIICRRLLHVRERVESARHRNLRVKDAQGRIGTPFVHETNVISEKGWLYWAEPILASVQNADSLLQASA